VSSSRFFLKTIKYSPSIASGESALYRGAAEKRRHRFKAAGLIITSYLVLQTYPWGEGGRKPQLLPRGIPESSC